MSFNIIKPTEGLITSFFNRTRKNPVLGVVMPHSGIDIGWHRSDTKDPVYAAHGGKVTVPRYSKIAGNYVWIHHPNGYTTAYSHLSKVSVKNGQTVKQGQQIGIKGTTGNSTGVHLHFELMAHHTFTNDWSKKRNPLLYMVDPTTKEWQGYLSALGFYNGKVDGIYGDGTIRAVLSFQKKHRLLADGVCGRGTYTRIKSEYAKLPQKPKPSQPQKPQVKPEPEPNPIIEKELFDMALVGTTRKDIMNLNNHAVEQGIFTHYIAETQAELDKVKDKSKYNKKPLTEFTDDELLNKYLSYQVRKETQKK